jgi:hypothetical protein
MDEAGEDALARRALYHPYRQIPRSLGVSHVHGWNSHVHIHL